jgi:hypothetical protein
MRRIPGRRKRWFSRDAVLFNQPAGFRNQGLLGARFLAIGWGKLSARGFARQVVLKGHLPVFFDAAPVCVSGAAGPAGVGGAARSGPPQAL